ncbi:MAG: hypothetical protein J1F36_02085 [Clostridiales bacterium]|nr:hypothetical protein [Clostridiales bacterium]
MTHKAKLTIIAILSCCALLSMGFASWVISQPATPEISSGTITVDNVINSSDYFKLASEPKGLDYTTIGFSKSLATDNRYKDTLTVTYTLDLNKCRELFGNVSVMSEISLGYNIVPEANLFAPNNNFVSAKITSKTNGLVAAFNQAQVDDVLNLTVRLDLSVGATVVEITVEYTFDLGTLEDYKTYIYNPFANNSELEFEFSAKLTERA